MPSSGSLSSEGASQINVGNGGKNQCHDWEKSWKLWDHRGWHLERRLSEGGAICKGFWGWIEVNYKEEGRGRAFQV